MDVNISNFMEEKRVRTEEAPYMEMKTSSDKRNLEKENLKPAYKTQAKQLKEEGFGLSLPLGEEYERKKQRLKQELRLDYRRFMSEKKNRNITNQLPQSPMLSLPIRERRSAKEKLQNERNKEYNLFLRGQEGVPKTGKSSITPQALERDHFGSITPKYPSGFPEVQAQGSSLSPKNVTSVRRDAATLTEPISKVHKVSRPRRLWAESPDHWGGPHGYYRDHTSSEEEQEGIELLEKERLRNIQEERDTDAKREGKLDNRTHRLQAPTPAQSRSVNEQNMTEFATGLMIGAAEEDEASRRRKKLYREELLQQIAEQQKNKRKEKELELRVAATGAVDPEKQPDRIKQFGDLTREYWGKRRNVPYRPGLALNVLQADSARRPKDERPLQASEERVPPERPRVAFQPLSLNKSTVLSQLANASAPGFEVRTGLGVNGTAPITEDYDRSLSSALGEMVAPRITGVRPPLGPSLTDSYQTPYDNAYYYYGARNPLDPNLAHYGPPVQSHISHISLGAQWPLLQPPSGGPTQMSSQAGITPSGPAFIKPERLQQTQGSALSYQEALKQQIRERQERRYQEKVEKEQYDAKIEAEMKAYDPWGRAGGGAPLRDDQGNLISDLKRMHKTNLEAYDSGGRRVRNPAASRPEPTGFSSTQPSMHARGNLFSELPTPQQLHEQEIYKDYLKRQIEEKRRKEAEERERQRLEEEKEERRLAEQRARIQREFEEEQERKRQKEKEKNAKNEELIRQAEERRKEDEKKRREAEERENETLRKRLEREKQTHLEEVHRALSPPLPALQRKLRQQTPRPPSAESHRSAAILSVRSMSAPHSPPVPARRNEIRATEEKQTVIRELSALRRQLRSEQRRLEGKLILSNRHDSPSPAPASNTQREHPPDDVFEMARRRKQVPIRRPASHTIAAVNMQNLQEFNRLKYRDGTSREEMWQAYPEPPGDDHSLDIQQQALLRQQQRTINSLKARTTDHIDLVSSGQQHHEMWGNSSEHPGRRLLLDSESAFIDPSADSFLLRSQHNQRARPDSARVRPTARKANISDDVITRYNQPDNQSLLSITSSEIERLRERTRNKMTLLNNVREQDWRSGDASGEEGEELWSQTPTFDQCVSIDTNATEPWLRPSSSDTLKRFMGGRRPSSQNHTNQEWVGPSTYHG
ncbi:centrosome and spindle pole-associated protein 1-like isoform X2 [Myxocyprinus asiaticus]|uniref:centrosome and spindle pole-associated protein 1-like isoform X2 n=1 Tax=Myxocyprinus asiaticus TaxID=70543 RepID=UPI002221921F|nr:centrosome and spindle pole-associated protein 1-like isoform X2 [Myxocyprinus asiaticus]